MNFQINNILSIRLNSQGLFDLLITNDFFLSFHVFIKRLVEIKKTSLQLNFNTLHFKLPFII